MTLTKLIGRKMQGCFVSNSFHRLTSKEHDLAASALLFMRQTFLSLLRSRVWNCQTRIQTTDRPCCVGAFRYQYGSAGHRHYWYFSAD